MPRIRVNVLGPAQLEVDGESAVLSPRAVRVLVRLVAAGGQPVGVRQLRWDLWRERDRPHEARNGRNQVQKGVSELRAAMGDGAAAVLRTERLYAGHGAESAYRLVLDAASLDAAEFDALVGQALHGPAGAAVDQLGRAVALWRGQPLAEAGPDSGAAGDGYAAELVRGWQRRYATALRELVGVHRELERFDLALPVAERLAAEFPADPEVGALLDSVRRRLRERHGDQLLRRDFPELRTSVVLVRGDLFEQHDAHLVVGFTDTFDVATEQDLVISRASAQGQLVERRYGGDTAALDRELRRVLRPVTPVATESTRAKPRGKRVRYPIGTVVAVPLDGRRVFATAYSRMGNDLVARSRVEDLALSLEALWTSAARYGQLAPIAVPLLGSGLSRLTCLSPEQLIRMIAGSFLRGCREHTTVATQLRIVLRPADLERTNLAQVAQTLATLD